MDTIEDSGHSPGPASSIKAIDKRSVHRICSGQVVLTLATAVKELVENSIDAGATSIEVRLKEYGVDLIEVIDNGVGVEAENFAGLTLKHHTSKLRDFGDLVNVDTFGFRGEALSSLCALSTLSVTTCHKDAAVGTKLEFNNNGHIVSQTPCARQTGTTVSLGQLFHTLPVRHKEFQRNIKKEFSKMVHVLNGYCLISTNIRITCTNQHSKGKKSIIVSTNGNDSIRENITNIFGPKQFQSLVKFVQVLPNEQVCNEYNIKVPQDKVFSIEGYVSSSEHGQGRGSSDRQFVFVNRRPCDLTKVSRVVNEVYHSYNRHQYPFVVLDISLAKDSVDVNVTPDKRQIFISEEKVLLGTIKTSLIRLFEPISSVFQVNQGQGKEAAALMSSFSQRQSLDGSQKGVLKKSASSPYSSPKTTLTSALASLKRSFSSAFNKTDDMADNNPATPTQKPDKQRRLDGFLHRDTKTSVHSSPRAGSVPGTPQDGSLTASPCVGATPNTIQDASPNTSPGTLPDTQQEESLTTSLGRDSLHGTPQDESHTDSVPSSPRVIFIEALSRDGENSETKDPKTLTGRLQTGSECANDVSGSYGDVISSHDDVTECPDDVTASKDNKPTNISNVKRTKYSVADTLTDSIVDKVYDDDRLESDRADTHHKNRRDLQGAQHKITEYDQAGTSPHSRHSAVVPFSMSQLRTRIKCKQKAEEDAKEKFRSFRAQISPSDNQAAEDELKKEIKKDMFSKMEILGQFNLGFIITRLGTDLFIVDQHATDEKYNFEMLQQHTVIRSQKLIIPQKLELTASNSSILIDNIEVFRTNGFEFNIDEEAPITSRVRLTAMPVSKNWTFGKDDIEELIFMLTDSPGVLCRPSRVRMMFASRACRKSIMVGTALNKHEMRKVVNHMGEIEQPWNCPHGRPTMRHLINMDCLHDLG